MNKIPKAKTVRIGLSFVNPLVIILSILLSFTYIYADDYVLKSGCEYDYPPYCFVNEDSIADGFSVELLQAVIDAMNLKVSFKTSNWNELKSELEQGKLDVLPLVGRTPEREHYFDFTIPYFPMHGAIVVRKDNQSIKVLDDINGKKIAVMSGDNAQEFVQSIDINCDIITTPTFKDALKDLSEGKYDAVIIQRLLAIQLINELGIKNLRIIEPPLVEFKQSFCFAVHEGNKELLAKLNEGLAIVIADGTYRMLHTKWFASIHSMKNQSILVGCDYNYPPWEFLDENGNPAGYNVDLTKAIALEMNLNIDFYVSDWDDVIMRLKNGDIDIIQGMFYSEERAKVFDLSNPHFVITQTAVIREDHERINSEEELQYMTVIVEKSDIMNEYSLKHDIDSIIEVETTEEALQLLSLGIGDCVLMGRIQAQYLIDKNELTNLVISDLRIASYEYCYAVFKGDDNMLSIFDEGLRFIKESGKYRELRNKWFGVYDRDNYFSIIKNSIIILVLLIIIIIAIMTWSFSLRQMVRRRTMELEVEIDEHKRAESALKDEENLLAAVMNNIPVMLIQYSSNTDIRILNNEFEKKTGWKNEDLQGIDLMSELFPDDNYRRDAIKYMSSTSLKWKEFTLLTRDRGMIDTEWCSVELDNNVYIGIGIDITERKKNEEQLRKIDRLDSLGILAGGIAHDFNNLLTGIIGNLTLIYSDIKGKSELESAIEDALKSSNSARDLTKQLLTFSSGGRPVKKILLMKEIIKDAARFVMSGSNNNLIMDIADNLWNAEADESQIKQVLQNIIMNANQSMPSGGNIDIYAKNVYFDKVDYHINKGNYIEICISDSGIGMEPDLIAKVFDPYFTTKQGGSGLGLAIVSSIIKSHSGYIDIKSAPGKGTAVTVYLPATLKSADEIEELSIMDNTKRQGRILVMDDEDMILKLVTKMLTRAGYSVETAKNGQDAINKYSESMNNNQKFNAVILDLTIPGGMGGKETAQHILDLDINAVLIVSSGYSSDDTVSNYTDFGFKGMVLKPYHMQDMLNEIERVLFKENK